MSKGYCQTYNTVLVLRILTTYTQHLGVVHPNQAATLLWHDIFYHTYVAYFIRF